MTYEPQGVFAEGWAFDFGQEAGIVTFEHAKSERIKKPKGGGSSKCEGCGNSFTVTRGAVGKYCSKPCMHQSRIESRPVGFDCSRCLASVGIGMNAASRLLGVAKGVIQRAWSKDGVKAQLPKGVVTWFQYAQRGGAFRADPFEKQWWGDNGKEWMDGYRPRFFDWGSIADHEVSKKRSREYQSIMYRTSPKNSNYRLKKLARSRIYNALKRIGKVERPRIRHRTEAMIGCTIEQLCRHLEAKFKRGMTWDNHGDGWHIDHIIPMAMFDLTDESQLLAASHYTNMQPMWAAENLAKSDYLAKDTQMQLRICATH